MNPKMKRYLIFFSAVFFILILISCQAEVEPGAVFPTPTLAIDINAEPEPDIEIVSYENIIQSTAVPFDYSKIEEEAEKIRQAEIEAIGQWLNSVVENGMAPQEVGVFVRSDNEVKRASAAVEAAGLQATVLDSDLKTSSDKVSIGTMHLAKGLEFRAVVVMACYDEVIRLQSRVETVTDQSDLDDVLNTERHLLYVACTRARDQLMLSSVDPASEFLDDLV